MLDYLQSIENRIIESEELHSKNHKRSKELKFIKYENKEELKKNIDLEDVQYDKFDEEFLKEQKRQDMKEARSSKIKKDAMDKEERKRWEEFQKSDYFIKKKEEISIETQKNHAMAVEATNFILDGIDKKNKKTVIGEDSLNEDGRPNYGEFADEKIEAFNKKFKKTVDKSKKRETDKRMKENLSALLGEPGESESEIKRIQKEVKEKANQELKENEQKGPDFESLDFMKMKSSCIFYLLELFETYELCYFEYKDIIPKLKDLKVPEVSKRPKIMSEKEAENFVIKLRKANFIKKINMIAFLMGSYNFHIFADYLNSIEKEKKNNKELTKTIFAKLEGSNYDDEVFVNINTIMEIDKDLILEDE